MEQKHLYQPFEIELWETSEYVAKVHRNSFFEMVFILEGRGIQQINQHTLPYAKDKLFLIFPQDTHGFEVHSPTKFFFIRFHDSYLKTQSKGWIQKLEYIFHNHHHLPGCILKNVSDKPLVRAIAEALEREQARQVAYQEEVVRQLINTMITIAARNISLLAAIPIQTENNQGTGNLLNYIHEHIYKPNQLKAEKVASHFNVSPTYISEFFKNKTGESLQRYIVHYKLKLIETRLRYTQLQINEIAEEFGFTDASHLNRLFKKYKGINPTEFRKGAS